MSAPNKFYALQQALAREDDGDDRAQPVTNEAQLTAQEVVEGMTIAEAREAMLFADTNIRSYEESKGRAIKAKAFIKAQLLREVE